MPPPPLKQVQVLIVMPPSTPEAGTSTYSYAPSTPEAGASTYSYAPSTLKQVQVLIVMPPPP